MKYHSINFGTRYQLNKNQIVFVMKSYAVIFAAKNFVMKMLGKFWNWTHMMSYLTGKPIKILRILLLILKNLNMCRIFLEETLLWLMLKLITLVSKIILLIALRWLRFLKTISLFSMTLMLKIKSLNLMVSAQ